MQLVAGSVIVDGHGFELSRTEPELLMLAEALRIPVATTPFGKGVFDPRHALSLGPTGRNGSDLANAARRNAEVSLALGPRLDDRATSAWAPRFAYQIPPRKTISLHHEAAEN